MIDLPFGIKRLTFGLPLGIDHVHSYLLPADDGWTLVDTGLGLPRPEARWAPLAELDAPVTRIVVTHFHPDHCGGAQDVQALTGAHVLQGADDYEQCERVWGSESWSGRLVAYLQSHGLPDRVADGLRDDSRRIAPFIRYVHEPELLREGDEVDGWQVLELPGHADGHICLLRDGVLVAGDHILGVITPTVGLYPESRPDPLGDFLVSLQRTIELAPEIALPGHHEPIRDPAGRAAEIVEHHRLRLEETAAALGPEPRNAYEISLDLFGDSLDASGRRFALAETLAHLERLLREGQAAQNEDGHTVTYTAA